MNGVDDDIAADFLVEALEIVERLGDELVQLERAPEDSNLLNAVFRGFHTIKGGAGFLNLPPLVEVCHAVEEPFNEVRSGQRALDGELFDASQNAVDAIGGMLRQLSAGQAMTPASPALMTRLHALQLGADGAPAAAHPAPAGAPAPAAAAAQPGPAAAAPAPGGKAAKADGGEVTVRVDTRRLDAIVNLIGEMVLVRNRLKTLRQTLPDEELERAVATLDQVTTRLQNAVMKTRMQPVGRVLSRFPKVARDVARSVKKEVELELVGVETELDRTLVDALADPMVHLVRNAIDHGIESPDDRQKAGKPRVGQVRISAQQEGDHIAIEIRDDGAGMDPEKLRAKAREKGLIDADTAARLSPEEALQLVFLPGFSTKTEVSEISGRGVGMDVVQSRVKELSGRVTIQSERGRGSRFLIKVPLTLAILPTLMVMCDGTPYALPLARVLEVFDFKPERVRWIDGRKVLDLRQEALPLMYLNNWLGDMAAPPPGTCVVLMQAGDDRLALTVDQVRGREEVVIKPLPRHLRGLPGYAGATLTGDGKLALILDVDGLAAQAAGV
ncbi:MAG TPA: chemotaxis protein CheA [Arenimonas sp.]|nr:chemotaxis protein CheA [Arenimonas sp.]